MSGTLNKATIIGHLGADPEIRQLPEGGQVANFSVATSDKWTDKDSGDKKEKVEWHRITIFNQPLVELAEKYLKKGSRVYIEGSLQTRKWDDRGVVRYSTEIVLRPFRGEITMLDSKPENSAEPAPTPPQSKPRPRTNSGPRAA